jgi:hypothetical protein
MQADELRLIIKLGPRRYPEYEEEIFKDKGLTDAYLEGFVHGYSTYPCSIYYFAIQIVKGRCKPAEHLLLTSAYWSYFYVKNIVKGRWIEGEALLLSSYYAEQYKELMCLQTNSD